MLIAEALRMDTEIVSVRYRYLFDHEVEGSDRGNLIDALEDELFPIRELLGEEVMNAAIREGHLGFETESEVRLSWFGEALRTVSVYLSEYIIGLELAEGRNAEGTRAQVELLKYVARTGDLIAVPLTHRVDFESGEVEPGPEDLEHLRRNWHALPRWAQDGFRLKFPELRVL